METNPESQPPQAQHAAPSPDTGPEAKKKSSLPGVLLGILYLACLAFGIMAVLTGPRTGTEPAKTKGPSLFKLDLGKDAIGLIRLEGVISMQADGFLQPEDMVERFRRHSDRLGKKKNIKALIVKINSPGGTVASSQEIYSLIRRFREKYKKPVVAFMGDVAASGGYYAASACDVIVAAPGTLTGSIGVIFHTTHFQDLAKRFGVEFNTIKSGRYKDIGNSTRAMLPDEKQLLQALIDNAYEQFVRAVTDGRKMPQEKVRELADGRIYTGQQAVDVGLIDSTGGFQEAVAKAKELGGIKGEPELLGDGDFKDNLLELIQSGSGSRFWGHLAPPSGLLYLWTGF